jgi:hypothetical protein
MRSASCEVPVAYLRVHTIYIYIYIYIYYVVNGNNNNVHGYYTHTYIEIRVVRCYTVVSLRNGGSRKFNLQNKTATTTESTAQVTQPISTLYT